MEHITTGGLDLPTKTIEPAPSEVELYPEMCPRHPRRGEKQNVDSWSSECAICEEIFNEGRRLGIPPRYTLTMLARYKTDTDEQHHILETARRFSEEPTTFGTGLILVGKCGTGKTMLASAILNERIERSINIHERSSRGAALAGRFISAIDFMRRVKETWRGQTLDTESSLLRKFSNHPLLIVDELGAQYGSEAERTIFTELINERYNLMKPTVLISNLTIIELSSVLGDRAIDRFREGGKVLVFDWPSWRGRNNKTSQSPTQEDPHADRP